MNDSISKALEELYKEYGQIQIAYKRVTDQLEGLDRYSSRANVLNDLAKNYLKKLKKLEESIINLLSILEDERTVLDNGC